MHIDWWTLGLQSINVLVLVWLLAHFFFKPVSKVIAARQQAVKAALADAEAAKAQAEDLKRQAQSAQAAIDADQASMRAAAVAEAQQWGEREKENIRAEIARTQASALAALADARRKAAVGDDARATQLAFDICGKLLLRLPGELQAGAFIEELLAAVEDLPASNKHTLAGATAPLELRSAVALSDSQMQRCRTALSNSLGTEVRLQFIVEPALVAGLELHSPHWEVCNSFRHDLEVLKSTLITHD